MTNVEAIKKYFEGEIDGGPGRPVTMAELKNLTPGEREELGGACRIRFGGSVEEHS